MITFKSKGDFHKVDNYLERLKSVIKISNLDKYGKLGVEMLQIYTPKDTGLTAGSWSYQIERDSDSVVISFSNSNIVKDYFNVAIGLQYGHGTKSGTWVTGVDYINPALQPIFEGIASTAWEEVTSL